MVIDEKIRDPIEDALKKKLYESAKVNQLELVLNNLPDERLNISNVRLITNENELFVCLGIDNYEREMVSEEYFGFEIEMNGGKSYLVLQTNMDVEKPKCSKVLYVKSEIVEVNLDGKLDVKSVGEGYLKGVVHSIEKSFYDTMVVRILGFIKRKNFEDMNSQLFALRSVMGRMGIGDFKVVGEDSSLVKITFLSGMKIVQNGKKLIQILQEMNKS